MPCDCSHLEATYPEIESKKLCQLLIYVYTSQNKKPTEWMIYGAENYYGNIRYYERARILLFNELNKLSLQEREKIIYNSKNKDARRLADWYESDYQKMIKNIKKQTKEDLEKKKLDKILTNMRKEETDLIMKYMKFKSGE